jgi:hypothetical protein
LVEEGFSEIGMNTRKIHAKRSRNKLKTIPQRPKHVPIEIRATLEQLRQRFRQKFGRDPGPNDPVFFDPDSEAPVPLRPEALNQLWERFADTLLSSEEITPEIAYAMKKTGLLVTQQNEPLLTEVQRKAWRDALHEYMSAHPMSNRH